MQVIFSALEKLRGRVNRPHIAFSIEGDYLKCRIDGMFKHRHVEANHIMCLRQLAYSYTRTDYMEYLLDVVMDELINFIDKEELQREESHEKK